MTRHLGARLGLALAMVLTLAPAALAQGPVLE